MARRQCQQFAEAVVGGGGGSSSGNSSSRFGGNTVQLGGMAVPTTAGTYNTITSIYQLIGRACGQPSTAKRTRS